MYTVAIGGGMALDDPNRDNERYERERSRIRAADVAAADRSALLAFLDFKDERNERSTAHKQANYVRRCAEIAAETGVPPITEWAQGDFERFNSRLRNAEVPDEYLRHCGPGGWGKGTLRQFRNALKQFLLYLGDRNDDDRPWTDGDPREWADDVELGASPDAKVDPSDLFRPDELAAMWTTIDNKRDAAMFALLYCTWQRNAVVRAFRIGDIETHNGGTEGVIRIYEDALGRKGASGRKPLSWAVGPVAEWLESHPRAQDPDAPILCQNHDAGSATRGEPFTTGNAINRRLQRIAKEAGLERDRWDRGHGRKQRTARSHLLRYTGATRAAKSDEYGESTVKKWGGWAQSSNQLDRYIQMTDDDVLASWADAHGINSAVYASIHPEFGTCERCSGPIEDWLATCPSCGFEVGAAPPETEPDLEEDFGRALSFIIREHPEQAHEVIDVAVGLGMPHQD